MKGEGYKEQRRQHPQQPCQRPAVFGLRGFFLPVAGNARLARLCRRFLKQTSPSFRGRYAPRLGVKETSPSFRGRYASPSGDLLRPEPGIHGVRRRGADSSPSGSSLKYGLNPMDPRLAVPRNFVSLRETRLAVPRNFVSLRETRFRGDDDAAVKSWRKRHAGLTRLCAYLSKHLRHSGAATCPASGGLLRPEPGIHGVRR